jgi:hypothetical protein
VAAGGDEGAAVGHADEAVPEAFGDVAEDAGGPGPLGGGEGDVRLATGFGFRPEARLVGVGDLGAVVLGAPREPGRAERLMWSTGLPNVLLTLLNAARMPLLRTVSMTNRTGAFA